MTAIGIISQSEQSNETIENDVGGGNAYDRK